MTWNEPPNISRAKPFDGSQMEKIGEAISALEKAIEQDDEDTIFLWTGGKEANVIADLLLYAVGDENGKSPVPFGIIDTGNQFEEIYEFRENFVESSGDRGVDTVGPFQGIGNLIIEKHEKMLEKIIENDEDPRGYHGRHQGWKCENCGEEAVNNRTVECKCGWEEKLEGIRSINASEEAWGVPESCGALKVKPMKDFIEKHGFQNLITGVRAGDMMAEFEEDLESGIRVEREDPAQHLKINPLHNWEEENVWAYIKAESISYPVLYNQGYRHTDSKCCTKDSDQQIGEYGEGGIDPEKEKAKEKLQEMGYI